MINELNQVLSNNILKHYGHIALVIVLFISVSQVSAQSILHRADSILAQRYLKGDASRWDSRWDRHLGIKNLQNYFPKFGDLDKRLYLCSIF